MLSMTFGVEDYYDWNTTGQNVFTDVRNCTVAVSGYSKNYEVFHDPIDSEAYEMFLNDAGLETVEYAEALTFSLEGYNEYLKDYFGPDAGQLTVDDFETGKSAKEKGFPVTGAISESDYRCFYSGKDDIIIVQLCATGYGCLGEYIYNIEKDGDDYYVYTVGEVETFKRVTDLNEFQKQVLNDIPYTIYRGWLPTKKYKFGCTPEGDVYLKSVDENYFIAENAEYDYVVDSEKPIEVKGKKAKSEDYKVISSIPNGTKVFRVGFLETYDTIQKEMYFVICEDCSGFVDSKYLKEISS